MTRDGEARATVLLIKARVRDPEREACAPPLGCMMLASVARERGWRAAIVDTYLERDADEAVRRAIRELAPAVIGLSALTAESKSLLHLCAVARAAAPDAVILVGGPHASGYAAETLACPAVDGLVVGEGEATFAEILDRIAASRPWQELDGVVVRDASGQPRENPHRGAILDLDTLPLPAFDLVDIDAYARRRGMSVVGTRRYMPLFTSRGCPYRCTYCHDIQGKTFRGHSPAYVLRMIRTLGERHDVHSFDVFDDIFNWDAPRMEEICDGLIASDRPVKLRFPNGLRTDRLTEALVDKLCRAGCEHVGIAIETATPRLQKASKKHLRLDRVSAMIDAFARRRVFSIGFFMLGFPTETEEEIRATIAFAAASKLHAAFFFTVTPFQGTGLHAAVAESMGDRVAGLDLTDVYFVQDVNLSAVSDRRFEQLKHLAARRFYLDPGRLWRLVRDIPQRNQLLFYGLSALRHMFFIGLGSQFRLLGRHGRARRALSPATPPEPALRAGTPPRVPSTAPGPARTERRLPVLNDAAG